ncbi:TPA: HEPN domain-containing protein [Stenotrophomonas maltophilia]|uniref:HEPN domain-containing protein n=1 Tax=Stenotrophomonas maltophilia TaxID=40324 RepID=UPI000C1480AB|nr:HEPN domain-containing protein [Stenotrophomonas maltophilia]HDS1637816.1 HEPN domain-containing protein [Stenotrophomonas maltophilia]HEL7723702.1 HEPN domain-containing protein [Stenotrophomonas maltophilia]
MERSRKDELNEWKWPTRPTNEEEFDAMMTSLDSRFSAMGIEPRHRGMRASQQVSWTLKLDGTPILGGPPDRGPPFGPRDLLAKVHDWYSDHYGDAMKIDFSPGSFLVVVNGNLWRVRLPMIMGEGRLVVNRDLSIAQKDGVGRGPAIHNVLCSVEGLTQPMANKLSDQELAFFFHAFAHGWQAIMTLDSLGGHALFSEAKADFRHSVDAIASRREYGKARWEAAQCAEKLLKGLLAREGHSYPKDAGKGHDHVHLGKLLEEKLGIRISEEILTALKTSPAVRYGEEASTLEQAMASHSALLALLRTLGAHHFVENRDGDSNDGVG